MPEIKVRLRKTPRPPRWKKWQAPVEGRDVLDVASCEKHEAIHRGVEWKRWMDVGPIHEADMGMGVVAIDRRWHRVRPVRFKLPSLQWVTDDEMESPLDDGDLSYYIALPYAPDDAFDIQPMRLRLSRKKGFRLQRESYQLNGLPAVNVARPSRFGNPFVVGKSRFGKLPIDKDQAVRFFREMLDSPQLRRQTGYPSDDELFEHLHGRNLACWCAPWEPCHADVLLRMVNC